MVGDLGFEPVHFYELLAAELQAGSFEFNGLEGVVTYHDPCRLGRQAGIFDSPRTLLESIPGISLKEMEHNRGKRPLLWNECVDELLILFKRDSEETH